MLLTFIRIVMFYTKIQMCMVVMNSDNILDLVMLNINLRGGNREINVYVGKENCIQSIFEREKTWSIGYLMRIEVK